MNFRGGKPTLQYNLRSPLDLAPNRAGQGVARCMRRQPEGPM